MPVIKTFHCISNFLRKGKIWIEINLTSPCKINKKQSKIKSSEIFCVRNLKASEIFKDLFLYQKLFQHQFSLFLGKNILIYHFTFYWWHWPKKDKVWICRAGPCEMKTVQPLCGDRGGRAMLRELENSEVERLFSLMKVLNGS